MGVEIERKYLVNKSKWEAVKNVEGCPYSQGYISTDPNKTIRIRTAGDKGFITIKGISSGMSRLEFEYDIPFKDATELLNGFCSSRINKLRYKIYHGINLWEVDEFLDDNEGLLIAEIELQSEHDKFEIPEWIGKEVT